MTVRSSDTSNIWLKIVSMPVNCNALQVIRKKLSKVKRIRKSEVFQNLKKQMADKYKLTLVDRIDPENSNIYAACVNDKVVCAVELPDDLSSTDANKEVVEGTLSHILSKSNGLCNDCTYINTPDCCKENFEEILTARSKERMNIKDFRKRLRLVASA